MISINGNRYNGNNITITNGKVIIDGVDQTPDGKEIVIYCGSNVDTINADVCTSILVTGDVGRVTTGSGRVEVAGSVKGGGIKTQSGRVECGVM